jgi:hypothetical protein
MGMNPACVGLVGGDAPPVSTPPPGPQPPPDNTPPTSP